MPQQILILDFGSQYTQLIARRIRELNVFCEIHPYTHAPALTEDIRGVVLSGSPCSVRDPEAPNPDLSQYLGRVPVLGVCYGAQLLAQQGGGEVLPATIREYGRARLSHIENSSALMHGLSLESQVWMSHGDTIKILPAGYDIIASTPEVDVAAYHIERPGNLRHSVSSRGNALHRRQAAAAQLRGRYLRLRPKLDARALCRAAWWRPCRTPSAKPTR